MAQIKVLDGSLINKIAAGEVVERPASVVKELCENSIDAGASVITVEIENGGTSLIRVSDNGCGIPAEQAKTAFLRHATSKLEDLAGLERILTLGFRGEALSSIAAVAMVELYTKTADEQAGSKIEINGGVVVSESAVGTSEGTSVTVRNLFYNTPARRKFLKKPSQEGVYVTDAVTRLALGRPDISFRLVNNGATTVSTNGSGDVRTAVLGVYGKETASKMLDVNFEKNGRRLSGLCGKPELARGNRSMCSFFINGRYIKSDVMQSAAWGAYKTRLPIGKFPVFTLYLTVAPDSVDVNVHPAKLEVRFDSDAEIYDLVKTAVENAFTGKTLIPSVGAPVFTEGLQKSPPSQLSLNEPQITYDAGSAVSHLPDITYIYLNNGSEAEKEHQEPFAAIKEHKVAQDASPDMFNEKPFFNNYKIIGQVFGTYWVIEQDESVYLIDQHAAHERVLYEEISEKLKSSGALPQRMIAPVPFRLSESERQTVADNMELLEEFGYEIEDMYDNTVAVRSVPYIFNNPAGGDFFMELVDRLSETGGPDSVYEMKLDAISQISCKAAVKANDRLSYAEAKSLIEKILSLKNPFTCPHGRPVAVELSRRELEKMFKRVQ